MYNEVQQKKSTPLDHQLIRSQVPHNVGISENS